MSLKLPPKATPDQLQKIAQAAVRFTFESDAKRFGPIEAVPPLGWKTTYWVGNQQFAITYNPRTGFEKQPILK